MYLILLYIDSCSKKYQLKYCTCITVSPLSRIFGGSISVIAGYPKLPYPKLKIRICDVNDNVGTSKEEPETHQNNVVMSDTMQPFMIFLN